MGRSLRNGRGQRCGTGPGKRRCDRQLPLRDGTRTEPSFTPSPSPSPPRATRLRCSALPARSDRSETGTGCNESSPDRSPQVDEFLWPAGCCVARQIRSCRIILSRFKFRALPSLPTDGRPSPRLATSLPGGRLIHTPAPIASLVAAPAATARDSVLKEPRKRSGTQRLRGGLLLTGDRQSIRLSAGLGHTQIARCCLE